MMTLLSKKNKYTLVDNQPYERRWKWWEWMGFFLALAVLVGAAATLIFIALHPILIP